MLLLSCGLLHLHLIRSTHHLVYAELTTMLSELTIEPTNLMLVNWFGRKTLPVCQSGLYGIIKAFFTIFHCINFRLLSWVYLCSRGNLMHECIYNMYKLYTQYEHRMPDILFRRMVWHVEYKVCNIK